MLKNKNLRLVTLNDDPCEQVIWNQDRPIAYLNRGDSTLDEFIELENLIQAAPKMNDALWAIANHIPESWGDECKDGYIRLNISADAIDAVEDAIHPDVSSTASRKAQLDADDRKDPNAELLEALEWLVDDCKLVAQGRKDNVTFTHITKAIKAISKARESAAHGD
jgi:hypothetical protein